MSGGGSAGGSADRDGSQPVSHAEFAALEASYQDATNELAVMRDSNASLQENVSLLAERLDQQETQLGGGSLAGHGHGCGGSQPTGSAPNLINLGYSGSQPVAAGVGASGPLGAGGSSNIASPSAFQLAGLPARGTGGGQQSWPAPLPATGFSNTMAGSGGLLGGDAGAGGGRSWPGFGGGGVAPPLSAPPFVGSHGFSGLPSPS